MTDTSEALHATQVLHCNLNVARIEPAVALYERGLELTVRMRSATTEGDATAMGIEEPASTAVQFLYDHRGGYVSPAIELMEWRRPPTEGVAYEDPTAVGMQALVFAVPSVDATTQAVVDNGGTRTGRSARDESGPVVEAELLDADGVRLELVRDDTVPAPTLVGVRLCCASLEESAAWYGELGWQRVGGPFGATWSDSGATARVQRLALDAHPFRIELTEWSSADRDQRAHERGNARGLFRMALAVPDVQAAYQAARSGGRVQIGEPEYVPLPGTPLGGLWVSFFRDPNGVMVELVERVTGTR